MRKKLAMGATAAVVAAGAVGGSVAWAASDDGEGTVTGPQADKATAAALEATGGGTANAVERDSENGGTWEVEVTTPAGDTVDVRLDENYEVVVIEGDSDSGSDAEDGTDSDA
ncbi:MAG: PepSY domain-containing protein [Nocardioidaceae bacterium]|nr:PepSY domain-containing protein [Nocardioidaceae bacterium]